jgi:hypothetical protein
MKDHLPIKDQLLNLGVFLDHWGVPSLGETQVMCIPKMRESFREFLDTHNIPSIDPDRSEVIRFHMPIESVACALSEFPQWHNKRESKHL